MKLSALITLNDRDISVMDTVFDSMRYQDHDEFVIVLDRTPPPLAEYVRRWWSGDSRTRFVTIDGAPGWRSPVEAWNAGFRAVTGDFVYAFSSETVQRSQNLEHACALLAAEPRTLIFGKAECSCGPYGHEVNWNGTAPGNLLCDSEHPRPLGFIWAGPIDNVRRIGGYDEAFAAGFWYDDNDFFYQLWRSGLDFAFDDSVSGIHLHHERPGLATPDGQAGIQRNASYILAKHCTPDPLGGIKKRIEFAPGRCVWRHAE
jgi:hypothetical protein